DPPSVPQSYPRQPDTGRVQLGFNGSYVDAIYRDIEVAFTASNATTQITFSGQNLQNVDDESWGIDNVSVRLTSDLTTTQVRQTTLPTNGSTNAVVLEGFTIFSTRDLLASSATNSANYVLREAGGNGALGDGDDVLIPLTPTYNGLKTVTLTIATTSVPLQPGKYRFTAAATLLD